MANAPAKKNQTAKTAAAKKNSSVKSGRPAGLFTWVAVGLVAAVIAGIVIVKVVGGDSATNTGGFVPTPVALANQVTQVPASVYDTVGVTSTAIGVTPPSITHGQPVLMWPDALGVKRPTVYYYGSEYCPYCAAQRWAVIVAMSRFGTFKLLGNSESSSTDVYPNTPTFTFWKSTFTSKYVNFHTVEQYSNVLKPDKSGYTVLQVPTAQEKALLIKYDSPTYIPGLPASSAGSIPFLSIGNQWLAAGASFSPSTLAGVTRDQVAGNLNDASNFLTQGIVSSANYITAAVCAITQNQPSNVCTARGVVAAKHGIGL